MSKEKPPETDSPKSAIPTAAAEWLTVFKKHFSIAFLDELESRSIESPQNRDLQQAAVSALIATLRDSGISEDQMLGFFSEAFNKVPSKNTEWTTEMAKRRILLIDRKIEGTISFDEKVELAGLTNSMRSTVDNEETFPIEGAKALHAKLKAMDGKEDQL